MNLRSSPRVHQRGATLIVGLIMLAVITVLVTSAFTLSTTNLKSVGNMQSRDEAIAAANKAIEQVLSSPFTTAPAADQINVDIDNNDTIDYVVQIAQPTCIRGSQIVSGSSPGGGSSVTLGLPAAIPNYNTIWDIDATVTHAATGTSVRVHQGLRVVLTQAQYNAVCA